MYRQSALNHTCHAILCTAVFAIFVSSLSAAPTVRDDLWVTNGPVYSSVNRGNNIGGATGAAIVIDTVTRLLDSGFPKVVGTVNAVVSDTAGGWYIGGNFTSVGGVLRNNLARIRADNSVDLSFDPSPDGVVNTLLLENAALFIGGSFATIEGQNRNNIAIINDLGLADWNPDPNGEIHSMRLSDDLQILYLGGNFTSLNASSPDGPITRNNLAAVGTVLNLCGRTLVNDWDPNPNGIVRSILSSVDDTTFYVGGEFTSIDGETRNRIAALDAAIIANNIVSITSSIMPGNLLTFTVTDIALNSDINVMESASITVVNNVTSESETVTLMENSVDSCVFSGTLMTLSSASVGTDDDGSLNVQVGNTITATYNFTITNDDDTTTDLTSSATSSVVADTDLVSIWDPNVTGGTTTSVNTMLLEGSTLYIGGDFTKIGSKTRNRIAAIDTTLNSFNAQDWDPDADDIVRSLLLSGTTMYVGGDFTMIGGQSHRYLASLDTTTNINNANDWTTRPNDDVVNILALDDTTLFVGGAFNAVTDESTLYIGGDFTYVGPSTGSGVGINTNAVGDLAYSNFPKVNGPIYAVVADGSDGWYIGGSFTQIGTDARNNIAHINSDGSLDTNWDPSITKSGAASPALVNALWFDGTVLYAGGDFDDIDSTTLNNIARFNSGVLDTIWNPSITKSGAVSAALVNALWFDGTVLYVGGDFDDIDATSLNNIARFNGGALDTIWNPNADGIVRTLVLSGASRLFAGGNFLKIGVVARSFIAEIDTTMGGAGPATNWNPDTNGIVRAMALSGSILYVGGDFTIIDADSRDSIAALDINQVPPDVVTTWFPNLINGKVSALVFNSIDMKLYIGGDFTTINGTISRNRIAVIDTDDVGNENVVTSWNPSIGNSVNAMALSSSGVLYAGGDFTSAGGVTRNYVAALNLLNGQATAWDPSANNIVRAITLNKSGSILYAGGDFTITGSQLRNRIAALDTTTGLPTAWNPDANNNIFTMALSDNDAILYIGGDFTKFDLDTINRNHLAALNTNATTSSSIITSWDPDAQNGAVHAMALFGTILYVGGAFTDAATIGAGNDPENRNRIAAIRTTDGTVNAWDPDANNTVRAMALAEDGIRLYVGGDFTHFDADDNNIPRNHIAALNTNTTTITALVINWDPDADKVVRAVALSNDGQTVYVGGDFTMFNAGAVSRNYIAALDSTSAVPITWWNATVTAPINPPVKSLRVASDGGTLFIGGNFSQVDTNTRGHLASFDITLPSSFASPAGGPYNSALPAVSLSCGDGHGPACTNIYYTTDVIGGTLAPSIDSSMNPVSPTLLYTGTISVSMDTVLKYFGVDSKGNQENVNTDTYVFEMDDPITTASPPSSVLNSNSNKITLTCNDGATGSGCAKTYYTIDDTDPTTSSTEYIFPVVQNDGSITESPIVLEDDTTLKYFSVDLASNTEAFSTETYIVDISPPRTTASPVTKVFFSEELTISFSCTDVPLAPEEPGVGAIPEGNFDPDTGLFDDGTGNLVGPGTDFGNPNAGVFTTSIILGAFITGVTTAETGLGCASTFYTTDSSTPTNASTLYTGPFTISDNTIIKYFSTDNAGNEEPTQRDSYISNYGGLSLGLFGPWCLLIGVLSIIIRTVTRKSRVSL